VLVELEVVMPPHTPLHIVHDVSLDLQTKVEKVPAARDAHKSTGFASRVCWFNARPAMTFRTRGRINTQIHQVERAFVHVDYARRDHSEHKEPRLL
jgi:hypothetical protein